jgi:aminopeptidase N
MAQDRDILPDVVKPVHYTLSLYDLELGGDFSYNGMVAIECQVKRETNEIVLNTHQLKITEAEFVHESGKTEQTIKSKDISENAKRQMTTFKFDDTLPVTNSGKFVVKFQGTMNNLMAGFYRSKYKSTTEHVKSVPREDDSYYMFSTQFESCDARRAFPCFDEPNLKATFDISIEIPDDQTALSNMPERATKKSKNGWKVVSFERTPIVSTYLVAWAFGDFEYIEDFTRRKYNGKSLPVRVYTTKGLKEQGRFALEVCHQIVDYFSEIFRIDYPLPKVDLLAVHEFSHGAMENWGLITYRTTAVLFDEANSDQKYKNRVAYVVCHELAHQHFGNLVTMDWWSELWLNEGFATWVGWLAVHHLYPEWNVWGQFVSESLQTAFQLDSLRNSHPIEVPVRDALEVDQIFDHISYLKGSSVIRMLSAHIGEEKFLLGVSNYLKAHQYANATTNDLWSALSEVSGQDVNAFMDFWIRKIGFPVITVAEEPGQIAVKQNRFLMTGDPKPEEDETTWWIPLGLKTGPTATLKSIDALHSRSQTIREVDESFYKLNSDQTGFFRTNYPPQRLAKFGTSRNLLSVEDKIGLVGDASSLAVSGLAHTSSLLALVENFKDEDNYLVWSQILMSLGSVRSVFSDVEDVSKGLRNFTLKLVSPAADKVGWKFNDGEDYLTGQLRALLIAVAGLAGHEGIVKEAKQQFSDYFSSKSSSAIHPSLRSAVFRIAITEGGSSEYEAVKNEFQSTSSIDGKEIALQSLGRVQSPDLAKDFLQFMFSPAVAVQDVHSGASALAANGKTRNEVWQFIKTHWDDKVYPRLSGNMVVLERFLRMSLNKFASAEVKADIEKFFEGKDNKGYDRALGVISDTLAGNSKYKERDASLIREWLGAHGYM